MRLCVRRCGGSAVGVEETIIPLNQSLRTVWYENTPYHDVRQLYRFAGRNESQPVAFVESSSQLLTMPVFRFVQFERSNSLFNHRSRLCTASHASFCFDVLISFKNNSVINGLKLAQLIG